MWTRSNFYGYLVMILAVSVISVVIAGDKAWPPDMRVDSEIEPYQYESVEYWLKWYPKDLVDDVEEAYRDDVITLSEYRALEKIKLFCDKRDAKARTKLKIKEIRDAQSPAAGRTQKPSG